MDEQLSCGQWIKQRRAILDLTQQDLAQRTRCSLVTVKGIESGRRRPSKQLATLLAQALEIPLPEQTAFVRWVRDSASYPQPSPELQDSTPVQAALHSEATPPVQAASLSPARYQLRAPVTDFTGRVEETSQLLAAFQAADQDGATICAIQGMGGIGKTELAYHVAHRLRAIFSDAQIVLQLRGAGAAPLSTEQALQAIIRTFMPDAKLPGELLALEQLYHSVLYNQRVLILADDARDAAQMRALIPPAGSALLITSRQRFTLPGMLSIHLEQLAMEGAVALLARICPRLSTAEAQAIAAACGRLPLALRVSGGILHNTPALPVALYIQGLADEQQRLAQLRDPDDALLDVAATLALSYDRLDGPAQQVFRQLGVIRADFATPLAGALVAPDTNVNTIDTLHLLLRRNLIIYDPERDRWRLHDLVRDLAQRALQAAGERAATLERYAQAAITIARDIHEQYLAGVSQALAALARFDRERLHIDAARQWATTMAGTAAGDALLVADAIATSAIGDLRYDRRRERLPQLEMALQAARRAGDRWGEKQILLNLGNVSYVLGALQQAITCFSEALAIARDLGDRHDENRTLNNLGVSYINLGDPQQGIIYYEQALAIARDLGDRRGEGRTLGNLGNAYMDLGDTQRAIPALEQALAIRRAVGNQQDTGYALNSLGFAYTEIGQPERAIPVLEQAFAIAQALHDRRLEGGALGNSGKAYLALGDTERALERCAQALSIAREIGDKHSEGVTLLMQARTNAARGETVRATSLFEQALTMLRELGDRWSEAAACWEFGLFLLGHGERERALPLMRAGVAYEREIGYTKQAEHAALLAYLESGESLAVELPQANALDMAGSITTKYESQSTSRRGRNGTSETRDHS